MGYSKKVNEFFADKKQMHRYGPWAKYLPEFFQSVVEVAPECADDVIDRMRDIKVRYKYDLGVNQHGDSLDGYTKQAFVDGAIKSGIRLDNGAEAPDVERNLDVLLDENFAQDSTNDRLKMRAARDAYNARQTFYHEMLHAIAGTQKSDIAENITRYTFGNTTSSDYIVSSDGYSMNMDEISLMIEEGVVENWATDIALNDIQNDYTHSADYAKIMVYRMPANFAAIWNMACNNQLRYEFLTGHGDDSEASKRTDEFKFKLHNLYRSFDWNQKGRRDKLSLHDLINISGKYADLINFCQKEFRKTKHSPEEEKKFNSCMSYLMSAKPLVSEIERIFPDFNKFGQHEVLLAYLTGKDTSGLINALGMAAKRTINDQTRFARGLIKGEISAAGVLKANYNAQKQMFAGTAKYIKNSVQQILR